ncbi:MAG: hypothetical protein M3245_00835, partial [Actinomycetota bacterium]|nr:hypothetical protein [Actinomycetota bacterium]
MVDVQERDTGLLVPLRSQERLLDGFRGDAGEPFEIPRMLVVTNDFPPRVGGAQRYVHDLVRHLPADRVSVLAPRWRGWREFDAAQPYPVHRFAASMLTPVPEVAHRVRSLIRETGAEVVLFGHALLAMLGPDVAGRAGVPYA